MARFGRGLLARAISALGPLAAFARSLAPREHPFATDPYLQGPNAPRRDEIELGDLPVEGRIPDDLEGAYLRNGPNPQFEPLDYAFPLDGDGMIHAVELAGGKAAYRNRWVETAGLRAERRAGRAFYGSLSAPFPPDRRLVGADGDPSPVKNVANTNVIAHAQRILALYEGGLPYELDAALRTKGTFDFGGAAGPTMTAHPKRDPLDGSLHFFSYGLEPPYLTYFEADVSGAIVRKQGLELAHLTVVHDCLLTERSFVLVIPPLFLDLGQVMRGRSLMRWEPERGAQILIVDRADRTKEPQRVTLEPFFFWHFLNGFEDGERLTIDLIAHVSLEASISSTGPNSSLVRLHVDRRSGSVRLERRDDRFVEFPRVAEAFAGRPYRYGYAAASGLTTARDTLPAATFDALVRYDMRDGSSAVHTFGPGCYPGEPAIVSKAGARDEGDVYAIAYVLDAAAARSSLVILEGADLAAPPLATVRLPVRIPNGFHGNWLANGTFLKL